MSKKKEETKSLEAFQRLSRDALKLNADLKNDIKKLQSRCHLKHFKQSSNALLSRFHSLMLANHKNVSKFVQEIEDVLQIRKEPSPQNFSEQEKVAPSPQICEQEKIAPSPQIFEQDKLQEPVQDKASSDFTVSDVDPNAWNPNLKREKVSTPFDNQKENDLLKSPVTGLGSDTDLDNKTTFHEPTTEVKKEANFADESSTDQENQLLEENTERGSTTDFENGVSKIPESEIVAANVESSDMVEMEKSATPEIDPVASEFGLATSEASNPVYYIEQQEPFQEDEDQESKKRLLEDSSETEKDTPESYQEEEFERRLLEDSSESETKRDTPKSDRREEPSPAESLQKARRTLDFKNHINLYDDEKLKRGCFVNLERMSKEELKKYSPALQKSREYLEFQR